VVLALLGIGLFERWVCIGWTWVLGAVCCLGANCCFWATGFDFCAGFFAAAGSTFSAALALTASARQEPVKIAMSFSMVIPWLIFFSFIRAGGAFRGCVGGRKSEVGNRISKSQSSIFKKATLGADLDFQNLKIPWDLELSRQSD